MCPRLISRDQLADQVNSDFSVEVIDNLIAQPVGKVQVQCIGLLPQVSDLSREKLKTTRNNDEI
jgi:hypothetical protein